MERIERRNVAEAAEEYLCNFAANKNLMRAIVSLQDGLKPVARRLFYSWWEMDGKPQSTSPENLKKMQFYKVASITSNSMQNYHPHGDTAAAAMVGTEGQYWNKNVMTIIPQGSFGNVRGDVVASGRYIEAKMSPYTVDCFFDEFDYYCVPMKLSYAGRKMEPEYLPAKYPHILFNGALSSMGTGLASNIPPFNVAEVLKATIKLLRNPDDKILLIPDSPTGADIVDTGNFKKIADTGITSFTLRATASIDYENNEIHINSLPISMTSDEVLNRIIDLKKKKMFDEIVDFIDGSKNGEVDLRFILSKSANPNKVLKELYKRDTGLKKTYSVGITYINDYKPYTKGVKDLLLDWIEYRCGVVRSMLNNKLQVLQEKLHMNSVLLMVFCEQNAEETLKICKNSGSRAETVEKLMKRYKITSLQAQTIADMRLYHFNKDSYQRFKDLEKKYKTDIDEVISILNDDNLLREFIVKQLEDGIKKYGRPRKSKIVKDKDDSGSKVDVPNTTHLIGVSSDGFIKKLSGDNSSIGTIGKENGNAMCMLANNRDSLIITDRYGFVTRIDVSIIPDMEYEDSGVELQRFYKVKGEVKGVLLIPYESSMKDYDAIGITFFTAKGIVKRVKLSEFKGAKESISGISVSDDDYVTRTMFIHMNDSNDIVIYTNQGNGIRLPIGEIRTYSKTAKGTKLLNLKKDEVVIGADILSKSNKYIFYITNKGNGKLTESKYLPQMKRGDDSIALINVGSKEDLVALCGFDKKDIIQVFRRNNEPVPLTFKDIPVLTRIAKGEKIVPVPKGDSVIAITRFVKKS